VAPVPTIDLVRDRFRFCEAPPCVFSDPLIPDLLEVKTSGAWRAPSGELFSGPVTNDQPHVFHILL